MRRESPGAFALFRVHERFRAAMRSIASPRTLPARCSRHLPHAAAPNTQSLAPSSSPIWWQVIWAFYLVAFVAVGGFGLRELKHRVPVTSKGSYNSTDTVFLKTLGVENASARIADCLRNVPLTEPVAVVYQNAPISEWDALLIGSIAWPRPIPQIPLKPNEALNNQRLIDAKATRAIFFLGMPRPHESEHVRSLSPLMHFYRSPTLPRTE